MRTWLRSNSPRAKAWRHTMTAAVNAGLEQKLFGLSPGQNYWSSRLDDLTGRTSDGVMFEFVVGDVPGLGWVCDAGYDELKIHSVLWPTEDAREWIMCGNVHDCPIGGAVANGWFERRDGCYLMPSTSLFRCENRYKPLVADLDVVPQGYADHGRFRM